VKNMYVMVQHAGFGKLQTVCKIFKIREIRTRSVIYVGLQRYSVVNMFNMIIAFVSWQPWCKSSGCRECKLTLESFDLSKTWAKSLKRRAQMSRHRCSICVINETD